MTIFGRVLSTARTWRSSVPLHQTLSPNPPPRAISPDLPFPPRRLCHRSSEHQFQLHSNTSEIENPKSVRKPKAGFGVLGFAAAFLGMFFGYADAAEFKVFHESVKRRDRSIQSTDTALANALNVSYLDSNDIDISKPTLRTIPGAVEGRKVSIKIQIPATRDAAQLIANIASDLGLTKESGGDLCMFLPYFFYCRIYWQVMLARPEKKKEIGGEEGDLRIHVFRSVIPFSDRFEIEFVKDGSWSPKELDALVSTFSLQLAGVKVEPDERQKNDIATLVCWRRGETRRD